MRVLEQCVAWAERRVLSARASSVSACAEVHAVSGGTRHLHVVPDVSTFGRLLPVGGKLRRGLGLELLRCGDVHSNPGPRLGLSRRALGGVRPTSPLHPSATSRQHWETMSKNVQLNIGTLNVRGFGEAAKAAEVATEMCQQNLNILVLTETQCVRARSAAPGTRSKWIGISTVAVQRYMRQAGVGIMCRAAITDGTDGRLGARGSSMWASPVRYILAGKPPRETDKSHWGVLSKRNA